jgi:hypothetical protein
MLKNVKSDKGMANNVNIIIKIKENIRGKIPRKHHKT